MSETNQIGVVGAGGWGTALAVWLARSQGASVQLWGYEKEQVDHLNNDRENKLFLPSVEIPKSVQVTNKLSDLAKCLLILFVTPSKATRAVAERFSKEAKALPGSVILSCTKGIEHGSGKRMTQILAEFFPESFIAALSGPSHAEEVARGTPCAVTIGAAQERIAKDLQRLFTAGALRTYTTSDVAGIELGGALKNIFAVAAGISDGLGLGDNAKAALVTRALAEMTRLGVALGGKSETFGGLSGIGDLMVTCFSAHSRNRRVGERIGKGETIEEIQNTMKMVAEGVPTARSGFESARKLNVETPIIDQVYRILYKGHSPKDALRDLLLREPKSESEIPKK